jgi:hypothetical protein
MCDWEGCTTGTIGLPNPNRRSVVKTSGFLHPYIYRYTARVPRDRFLVLEREGITWMGQPSCQGIALFSVRIEFWRSTGAWSSLAHAFTMSIQSAEAAARGMHRRDSPQDIVIFVIIGIALLALLPAKEPSPAGAPISEPRFAER